MGVMVCIMALYRLIGKMVNENSYFQYMNQLLSENFVKMIFCEIIFLAFLTIQTKNKTCIDQETHEIIQIKQKIKILGFILGAILLLCKHILPSFLTHPPTL